MSDWDSINEKRIRTEHVLQAWQEMIAVWLVVAFVLSMVQQKVDISNSVLVLWAIAASVVASLLMNRIGGLCFRSFWILDGCFPREIQCLASQNKFSARFYKRFEAQPL